MNKHIEAQLKEVPDSPGVYLMKNEQGQIIYVGKAKSLRKRIRSYFRRGKQSYKTKIMVDHISDFDYFITDTEVEAYILEANLIKKYQPHFNIRLKDDKSYPYIKVTVNEDYPRIYKTRVVKKDGSRYFGPFANVDAIYKTINVLKNLFSLRTCKKDLRANQPEARPCLNYYIDKCLGPCIGAVKPEEYRKLVDRVCLFLSGHQDQLIAEVEKKMRTAAAENNFEKAARLRDQMQALQEISKQQKVMSDKNIDQDVIALIENEDSDACVQLLLIRNGRLIGQEYFRMEGTDNELGSEVMSSFLIQYYEQAPQIPDEIILNTKLKENRIFQEIIKQKTNRKISIQFPQKGNKKRLLEMAERNARENLKREIIRKKYRSKKNAKAMEQLKEYLDLACLPRYIEGFDISNIQGTDPVASMVVFKQGSPSKKDYRRFKIKSVIGPDDFAMMKEVISRRYTRLTAEGEKLPDLVLIDGGKGQLNAVLEIFQELGLELSVIGLAKKEEEVFLPDREEPVIISHHSPALHLLQRVRDEAHRFAVNYHRKLRSRRLTHSMLDNIPGVGPGRRKALLNHFGSLEKIKNANITKLKEVDGISNKTARKIHDYLRENTRVF